MATLKAGTRMRSAVCKTEVMVIVAPAVDVQLSCGGAAMIARSETPPPGGGAAADSQGGDPPRATHLRAGRAPGPRLRYARAALAGGGRRAPGA